MTTFDMFIDQFDKLDIEEQMTLAEILKRHAIEKRRAGIAADSKEAVAEYYAGKSFSGIDELFKEIGHARN